MSTIILGTAIAVMAAVLPLSEIVHLVNIGTLFAFVLVNIGVIVLRRTEPDMSAASASRARRSRRSSACS